MQKTTTLSSDVELENIKECDLCGSENICLWDRARSNELSRCRGCGLVFTNPRIADSKVKDQKLYSADYFQQKSRMTEKLISARKKSYAKEIAQIERYVPQGKILDVGCGIGIFLDQLGEQWEKYGCDVSSFGLEEARKKGIKTYQGEFENLDFGGTLFDLIYFRASLHHTYRPKECLKKANRLLKDGGMIAIVMSNNYGSLCGNLFRGHIKSYEQAHNYLFSKKVLKRYLQETGFQVLNSNYPYWGTGYESVWNFIEIVPQYIKYLFLKMTDRLNKAETYNFCSPTFWGNYVSLYAKKVG